MADPRAHSELFVELVCGSASPERRPGIGEQVGSGQLDACVLCGDPHAVQVEDAHVG